ncbi:hypothetical protein I553_7299 [Mycobacterium xenopi 4042]|uniref:Uncharacterized protein n=1 Tax=Mycobacterium xenopi 4042 TaxID=1299334 RepID=X8E859_MYCXE|nr:hypothetical protein I553_7299 [Mycobacterium xenopi 4042]
MLRPPPVTFRRVSRPEFHRTRVFWHNGRLSTARRAAVRLRRRDTHARQNRTPASCPGR